MEAYKTLTHLQLCQFYPAIIDTLEGISKGSLVSKVLKPEALDYLSTSSLSGLLDISHKGHKEIFESIFSEIANNALSIVVIEKLVPLIAESYRATFCQQTSSYLDGGDFKKMLDDDPSCLDGVPGKI